MGVFSRPTGGPREAFAAEAAKLAAKKLKAKVTVVDDLTLGVADPDPATHRMHLDNLWEQARHLSGKERQAAIAAWLDSITGHERPQSWTQAAPMLRPAVRRASWTAAAGAGGPVRAPFLPFVHKVLAIDVGPSLTFAKDDDLRRWGVTAGQADQQAVTNLTAAGAVFGHMRPVGNVLGPDGHISSWLAAPAALQHLAAQVGPELVVLAPSRDELTVIDAGQTLAVAHFLDKAVETFTTSQRRLSPVPYLLAGNTVTVWQPPFDEPIAEQVASAQRLLALVEYNAQKTVLDKLHHDLGEQAVVEPYVMMDQGGHHSYSYTTWAATAPGGLIPPAEYLIMGGTDHPDAMWVSFRDALEVLGPALTPAVGYDPPLWRHHGWPSPQTMADLQDVAIPEP